MIYKMYLCKPTKPKEALFDWKYYAPKNGVFHSDNRLDILEPIIVRNIKRKGYVEELLTGMQIPSLYVIIENQDFDYKNKYFFDLEGNLKNGIYVFGIKKQTPINDINESMFYENPASVEEIFEYQRKHDDLLKWKSTLKTYLEEGQMESQTLLSEKRIELKDQIKNQMLNLVLKRTEKKSKLK